MFIEGALRTRKWQDQSGADRYSTEIHPTQYNATLTFLDARKEDARILPCIAVPAEPLSLDA